MAYPLIFYPFVFMMLACALGVVVMKNTVYNALALILTFIHAAILMLLVRAEFLSFVVMIVYVGAVAVLFLFIVMMLDFKTLSLRGHFGSYLPVVLTVVGILLCEVFALCYFYKVSPYAPDLIAYPRSKNIENIVSLGTLLYTRFALVFQISGMILLLSMISAIILTLGLKTNPYIKKQNVKTQLLRSKQNSLAMIDQPFEHGVSMADIKKITAPKSGDF